MLGSTFAPGSDPETARRRPPPREDEMTRRRRRLQRQRQTSTAQQYVHGAPAGALAPAGAQHQHLQTEIVTSNSRDHLFRTPEMKATKAHAALTLTTGAGGGEEVDHPEDRDTGRAMMSTPASVTTGGARRSALEFDEDCSTTNSHSVARQDRRSSDEGETRPTEAEPSAHGQPPLNDVEDSRPKRPPAEPGERKPENVEDEDDEEELQAPHQDPPLPKKLSLEAVKSQNRGTDEEQEKCHAIASIMGSSTTASPAHQRGDLLLLEDTSHGGASPLGLMSVGDHSDYIDHPRHVVGAHHLPHLRAGGLMAGQEQHYQLFQQNSNHFSTSEDVPDSAAALGGAGIPSRSSSVRGLVVPGGRISSHAGAGLFRAASSSSSISAGPPDHHGSEDRDRTEREHAEHLQQFSAGGTPFVPSGQLSSPGNRTGSFMFTAGQPPASAVNGDAAAPAGDFGLGPSPSPASTSVSEKENPVLPGINEYDGVFGDGAAATLKSSAAADRISVKPEDPVAKAMARAAPAAAAGVLAALGTAAKTTVDTNTTSATTAAQSGASSALQHQPHPYQSTVDRLIGTHSHNAAALEGSATPFYREPPALDPKMLQPLHHPQVSIVADATDYQNPATALDDVYRGWGHMGSARENAMLRMDIAEGRHGFGSGQHHGALEYGQLSPTGIEEVDHFLDSSSASAASSISSPAEAVPTTSTTQHDFLSSSASSSSSAATSAAALRHVLNNAIIQDRANFAPAMREMVGQEQYDNALRMTDVGHPDGAAGFQELLRRPGLDILTRAENNMQNYVNHVASASSSSAGAAASAGATAAQLEAGARTLSQQNGSNYQMPAQDLQQLSLRGYQYETGRMNDMTRDYMAQSANRSNWIGPDGRVHNYLDLRHPPLNGHDLPVGHNPLPLPDLVGGDGGPPLPPPPFGNDQQPPDMNPEHTMLPPPPNGAPPPPPPADLPGANGVAGADSSASAGTRIALTSPSLGGGNDGGGAGGAGVAALSALPWQGALHGAEVALCVATAIELGSYVLDHRDSSQALERFAQRCKYAVTRGAVVGSLYQVCAPLACPLLAVSTLVATGEAVAGYRAADHDRVAHAAVRGGTTLSASAAAITGAKSVSAALAATGGLGVVGATGTGIIAALASAWCAFSMGSFAGEAGRAFLQNRSENAKVLHAFRTIFGDDVKPGAHLTKAMLRKAYYATSRNLHPDKGGDQKEFADLAEAYKTLIEFLNEQAELLETSSSRLAAAGGGTRTNTIRPWWHAHHNIRPCTRFSSVYQFLSEPVADLFDDIAGLSRFGALGRRKARVKLYNRRGRGVDAQRLSLTSGAGAEMVKNVDGLSRHGVSRMNKRTTTSTRQGAGDGVPRRSSGSGTPSEDDSSIEDCPSSTAATSGAAQSTSSLAEVDGDSEVCSTSSSEDDVVDGEITMSQARCKEFLGSCGAGAMSCVDEEANTDEEETEATLVSRGAAAAAAEDLQERKAEGAAPASAAAAPACTGTSLKLHILTEHNADDLIVDKLKHQRVGEPESSLLVSEPMTPAHQVDQQETAESREKRRKERLAEAQRQFSEIVRARCPQMAAAENAGLLFHHQYQTTASALSCRTRVSASTATPSTSSSRYTDDFTPRTCSTARTYSTAPRRAAVGCNLMPQACSGGHAQSGGSSSSSSRSPRRGGGASGQAGAVVVGGPPSGCAALAAAAAANTGSATSSSGTAARAFADGVASPGAAPGEVGPSSNGIPAAANNADIGKASGKTTLGGTTRIGSTSSKSRKSPHDRRGFDEMSFRADGSGSACGSQAASSSSSARYTAAWKDENCASSHRSHDVMDVDLSSADFLGPPSSSSPAAHHYRHQREVAAGAAGGGPFSSGGTTSASTLLSPSASTQLQLHPHSRLLGSSHRTPIPPKNRTPVTLHTKLPADRRRPVWSGKKQGGFWGTGLLHHLRKFTQRESTASEWSTSESDITTASSCGNQELQHQQQLHQQMRMEMQQQLCGTCSSSTTSRTGGREQQHQPDAAGEHCVGIATAAGNAVSRQIFGAANKDVHRRGPQNPFSAGRSALRSASTPCDGANGFQFWRFSSDDESEPFGRDSRRRTGGGDLFGGTDLMEQDMLAEEVDRLRCPRRSSRASTCSLQFAPRSRRSASAEMIDSFEHFRSTKLFGGFDLDPLGRGATSVEDEGGLVLPPSAEREVDQPSWAAAGKRKGSDPALVVDGGGGGGRGRVVHRSDASFGVPRAAELTDDHTEDDKNSGPEHTDTTRTPRSHSLCGGEESHSSEADASSISNRSGTGLVYHQQSPEGIPSACSTAGEQVGTASAPLLQKPAPASFERGNRMKTTTPRKTKARPPGGKTPMSSPSSSRMTRRTKRSGGNASTAAWSSDNSDVEESPASYFTSLSSDCPLTPKQHLMLARASEGNGATTATPARPAAGTRGQNSTQRTLRPQHQQVLLRHNKLEAQHQMPMSGAASAGAGEVVDKKSGHGVLSSSSSTSSSGLQPSVDQDMKNKSEQMYNRARILAGNSFGGAAHQALHQMSPGSSTVGGSSASRGTGTPGRNGSLGGSMRVSSPPSIDRILEESASDLERADGTPPSQKRKSSADVDGSGRTTAGLNLPGQSYASAAATGNSNKKRVQVHHYQLVNVVDSENDENERSRASSSFAVCFSDSSHRDSLLRDFDDEIDSLPDVEADDEDVQKKEESGTPPGTSTPGRTERKTPRNKYAGRSGREQMKMPLGISTAPHGVVIERSACSRKSSNSPVRPPRVKGGLRPGEGPQTTVAAAYTNFLFL